MSDTALYVGNNMEFTVDAISDVTIYFNKIGTDSDTENYPSSSDLNQTASCRKFALRADQTILIVGMDNITFKNPITVVLNTPWVEKFDTKYNAPISKMVIRTTVTGTAIKLRWHGGI